MNSVAKRAALLKNGVDTEMIEAALKKAGCEVVIYPDREKLLAAMKEQSFNIASAGTAGKPY